MGAIVARLAPLLARAGASAIGQAAKTGAVQGVQIGAAGRVANMMQGKKDGEPKAQNENLQGYFPGRGGY
jgi:hypothetical protein